MKQEAIAVAQTPRHLWALPVLLLLVLIAIKPVPFIGGGTDDYKYLVGAHCLECLPTNHWERRFPIVWPTGLVLHLPIPTFYAVMIWPVMSAIACVLMLYALVQRQWGQQAGILAAVALVCTPIFANRSMRIAIDVVELAFLLGSVLVLQRRRGAAWSGVLLALAVMCRPTTLSALPALAAYSWWLDRKSLPAFFTGLAGPLAIEALVYWVAAGNPLYSWQLSLSHSARPSSFLSPTVDTTKSPLFNPDFIAGWKKNAGVSIHWTVDPILNLLKNITSGPVFWAAISFLVLSRRLDRAQAAILVASMLYFGALTYAFAIDPQPRMFLPVLAVAAALFGSAACRLPVTMGAAAVGLLLAVVFLRVPLRTDYTQEAKAAAAALHHEPREFGEITRERLSLFYWNAPSTPGARPLWVGRPCNKDGSCF